MKEQLERMFPGAVVTNKGTLTTAAIGKVRFHVWEREGLVRVTVRAFIGQGQASRVVYGSGLEEVIDGLRHDLKMKTESVGDGRSACVARDRAARVLRVLDAAKVGEVTL